VLKNENKFILTNVFFVIVDYNSLKQGCGARTQISGSGSGSRSGFNIWNVRIGSI